MAEYLSVVGGVVSASSKLKEYVIIPIQNQYSYLFRCDIIIEGLRIEAEELNSRRNHLQQQIESAQRNLHSIIPRVQNWCSRVDELKEPIDRVFSDAQQADQNGKCLRGMCPNLKVRYSLSRKAMKLTADVVQLRKDIDSFSNISYPIPLMAMETIPSSSNALEFESRKKIEEEIMGYLRDDSVHVIGLCGMGGVGKTTMAKKIKEMAIKEKLFDETVMVVVSQESNPLKIQQELGKGLDLNLTHEEVSICAKYLYNRLKDKKVLIILDDVWEWLKLEELGIEASHSKILITSRDRSVYRMMWIKDATRILTVEVLDDVEAFSLFRENAGSVVDESNLCPLAKELAKECKGLPLAIETVGRALREQTKDYVWKDSLLQLRNSAPTNIPGYLRDVYQPLKLSYEHLISDEVKYLFLLCCLFPEDSRISIENLVHLGMGLRLLSCTKCISDARTRVQSLVDRLIDRCLLIDAGEKDGDKWVKMHDIIRDMAIYISSSGKHVFLVSHDKNLKEWPGEKADEDYTCISVSLGTEKLIWESRNWPKLEAIYIASNKSELSVGFFNRMTGLKLLSLDMVSRLSLSSLQSLAHLRVLRLYECDLLHDISSISQLVNLEILICRECDIEEIPGEIGALTKLKLLDFSYCDKMKNIAPGVVSGLVQMEEFRLLGCPIEWGYEEQGGERKNASLAEVFTLENLSVVQVWIQDLQAIPPVPIEHSFPQYSISIGPNDFYSPGSWLQKGSAINYFDWVFGRAAPTYLKRAHIHFEERGAFAVAIFSKLFEAAEELELENGTQGIIDELGRQGFKNVKSLNIQKLGRVKHLSNAMYSGVVFPVLRRLRIVEMDDLEEVSHGVLTVGSFYELQHLLLRALKNLMYIWKSPCEKFSLSNLKSVAIENCANLKWVFPLSVVESLCQLEVLSVQRCQNMEMIFEDDIKSESDISIIRNCIKLPNLTQLSLLSLPRLGVLCKADDVFEFPSIQTLQIMKLSSNFELSKHKVAYPKLKDLWLNSHNMEIFYHKIPIDTFGELRSLQISYFHSSRTLFSEDIFKSLINLGRLVVEDCLMLESICGREGVENEGNRNMSSKTSIVILPNLRWLTLSKLPKIQYFCPFGSGLELPSSLISVTITDCPEMETFGLESCSISTSTCSNFSNECFFKQVSFRTLGTLEIQGCHNMESLFTPDIFQCLTNIWWLRIEDCSRLEYVIVDDNEDGLGMKHIFKMSKLKHLTLSKLPKMCKFSNAHCDLELPLMEDIHIFDCNEMMSFGVECMCMPTGVRIYGILDLDFASGIFFNREVRQDENIVNDRWFITSSDLLFTWDSNQRPSLLKGLSDTFFLHGWMQVNGKFEIQKLSSGITYEIAFVIMLLGKSKPSFLEECRELETSLEDEKHVKNMINMPTKEWIEIVAGEFKPTSNQYGEITFSLKVNPGASDVILKGVVIRPKENIV